jgi:hypothetical protein
MGKESRGIHLIAELAKVSIGTSAALAISLAPRDGTYRWSRRRILVLSICIAAETSGTPLGRICLTSIQIKNKSAHNR